MAASTWLDAVVLTLGALAVLVAGCGADEVLAVALVENAATELLVVVPAAGRGSVLIGAVGGGFRGLGA